RRAATGATSFATPSPATSAAARATGRSSTRARRPWPAAATWTRRTRRAARLASLPKDATLAQDFFAPVSVAALADFLLARPQATILAGGTDVGLLITKQHKDLPEVAYT